MAGKSRKAGKAAVKADGANRRRFDRRDTAIPAWLSLAGKRFDGHVTNLSLDGCLFNPAPDLAVGEKVKIWLSGRDSPVNGKVVMRSERGLHCRLSVAAPALARMSAELDDMALLLLGATRTSFSEPALPLPVAKSKKPAAKKQPAKKSPTKKPATKKPAAKKAAVKKAAKKKSAKKKR